MSQEGEKFQGNDESAQDDDFTALKQQVTLSSKQMQQCVKTDAQKDFQSAVLYLSEAERLLEYAANFGKTIQRSLIITTLNNEACVYQRLWEQDTAANYIQAIIFNLNSYLQAFPEIEFVPSVKDPKSVAHTDLSIYITRKTSLAIYMLQFCAVSSQNKNHSQAYSSAVKTISILRDICDNLNEFKRFLDLKPKKAVNVLASLAMPQQVTSAQLPAILTRALKGINKYMNLIKTPPPKELDIFKTYSIGHLMQIQPIQIKRTPVIGNLMDELTEPMQYMKAIYISIAYFTMATQLRYLSLQKYTLDEIQRKQSQQYKDSHLYQLMSIITVVQYLPCESPYFKHIVKNYQNHYELDLIEQSKKYQQVNKEPPPVNTLATSQFKPAESDVRKVTKQVLTTTIKPKSKVPKEDFSQREVPNPDYFKEQKAGKKTGRKSLSKSKSKDNSALKTARSDKGKNLLNSDSKKVNQFHAAFPLKKSSSKPKLIMSNSGAPTLTKVKSDSNLHVVRPKAPTNPNPSKKKVEKQDIRKSRERLPLKSVKIKSIKSPRQPSKHIN